MPDRPDVRDPAQRKRAVEGARSYAYYSGLAIQMVAVLLIAHFGSDYVIRAFQLESPLWKAGLMLLGVALALYLPLRGLVKS